MRYFCGSFNLYLALDEDYQRLWSGKMPSFGTRSLSYIDVIWRTSNTTLPTYVSHCQRSQTSALPGSIHSDPRDNLVDAYTDMHDYLLTLTAGGTYYNHLMILCYSIFQSVL